MKRIFLLAAALGCILLYSCDNEQDLSDLSPIELEILELDNLIASQSGFDEETLFADLNKGTMYMRDYYGYNNGNILSVEIAGGHREGSKVIFFENGACFDCYDSDWLPVTGSYPCNNQFSWQYDQNTRSLITQYQDGKYYDNYNECSAKILYYNTEDHRLIIEGDFLNFASFWKLEKVRMSGYIDVDAAERERIIEKYCGE